ncbi:actin patch 1 [Lecanosticta acicola]|uniref:Actin patch 1 n=1 Tax=Lecanosticta acicola TaxID=111012 RepID=A0AAI8Z189_9PEZI|nr:actin patch 1 [Lecanosticta acicola]
MASGLGYGDQSGLRSEGREPGARRKKLAGYLKAANELRQNYFSGDTTVESHGPEDGPGAFPEAAVVRSGNEEMILFPSYARKHVESKRPQAATPGREMTEEEYWRREWEKNEDINAMVDVDVRGWIYTPPRGPHTRKQRLLIGLARQLSGIPAPPSNKPGESSQSSTAPSRNASPTRQQDEDLINFEADQIVRRGQEEERYASRGAFYEKPGQGKDTDSLYGDAQNNADRGRHSASYASTVSSQDSDPGTTTPVQKRSSWPAAPAKMSSAELHMANTHLMTRLKPFMANPLANTAMSAFFYSESASRQRTVYTDASGHFSFRAALDFTPTHVRVLAGEKLSATEEVHVTSPKGVSLISDIDDTIKHSAISAGAREIFRNAFIRDLGDLTIDGVREWYNTLHDMGVKIHYVSNSPWQMYPVLTSYFKLANLPKGSFHLKQYSGMLQGIFEPVAERKKSSLDKIMRDFPDRKFVLCGDSGEADLEVYTEVALDNPGRILGIFIRDVTTTVKTGYFDPNSPPGSRGHTRNHSRDKSGDSLAMSKRIARPPDIRDDNEDLKTAIAASLEDMEAEARRARRSINPDAIPPETRRSLRGGHETAPAKPNLPPRPPTHAATFGGSMAASPEEDLIDFADPPPTQPWLAPPVRKPSTQLGLKPTPSPPPPPKPAGLRSPTPEQSSKSLESASKTPPPRPGKPSSAVKPANLPQIQTHQPSPLSQVTRQESTRKPAPPLPMRPKTFRNTIVQALPGTGAYWQGDAGTSRTRPLSSRSQPTSPLARPMSMKKSFEDLNLPEGALNQNPPAPPPPRRTGSSYSLAQVRRRSSNRRSGAWDMDDGPAGSPGDGVSKKEFMWKQRWARAQNLLERNGVTLRSWRVGSDVADVCVKLIEQELRKIEWEERGKGNGNGSAR